MLLGVMALRSSTSAARPLWGWRRSQSSTSCLALLICRALSAIPGLESIGYEYMPQPRAVIPGWRFFAKPIIRPRSFHLHGLVLGGPKWNDLLFFRNALRADPLLARRYADLKHSLARKHYDDRSAYTDEKAAFIQSVLERRPE